MDRLNIEHQIQFLQKPTLQLISIPCLELQGPLTNSVSSRMHQIFLISEMNLSKLLIMFPNHEASLWQVVTLTPQAILFQTPLEFCCLLLVFLF